MRIALYDGTGDGGHHTFMAEPIGAALAAAGHDVLVLRPEGTIRHPDPRPTRVAVPPAARQGAPLARSVAASIRSCATAHRAARAFGADAFVDLELDLRVFARLRPPRGVGTVVYCVHGKNQLDPSFGRDHPLRPLKARLRTGTWRRAVLSAEIVCFRDVVADAIVAFEADAHPHLVGYPILDAASIRAARELPGPRGDGRLHVLLAGQIRPDKAPGELVAGLAATGIPTVLEVAGTGASRVEAPAGCETVEIVRHEGLHSDEDFARFHRRASLVVGLVPDGFEDEGRVRGTMLKAVGFGAPVLTNAAGLRQLPPDYPAVVTAGLEPADIAAAVFGAADALDAMKTEASRMGPEFLLADHTFETFAAHIVRIAGGGEPGAAVG